MSLFLKEAFGLLRVALTVKDTPTQVKNLWAPTKTIQAKEGQAVSCAWKPQRREGGTPSNENCNEASSRLHDKTLVSIKGDRNGASAIS